MLPALDQLRLLLYAGAQTVPHCCGCLGRGQNIMAGRWHTNHVDAALTLMNVLIDTRVCAPQLVDE